MTVSQARRSPHWAYINVVTRRVEAGELPEIAAASPALTAVREAVGALPAGRYLLAVSGGLDSIALLDAWASTRPDAVAVATFDHGTGSWATKACRLVEVEADRRGLAVVSGSADAPAATESEWRRSRWRFLHGWAREFGAQVVTAHTQDDQLETVVMRVLRDSGARGLAAMYAPSPVARPLLGVSRATLEFYARERLLRWTEDPSNVRRVHLRNRVRHDLLPALQAVRPTLATELLALSARAAALRAEVEAMVDRIGAVREGASVVVSAATLAALDPAGLAVLWPAIAGRVGVALDWRGAERVVAFTTAGRPGGRIPLSGGAEVRRTATTFVLAASPSVRMLYS